mgnify:CR=1 FL=1
MIRGFGWWLCMHSHTDERRDLGRGHGNREGFGPVRGFWTLSSRSVMTRASWCRKRYTRGAKRIDERSKPLLEEFNLQINSDRLNTTQSSTHNHTHTIL